MKSVNYRSDCDVIIDGLGNTFDNLGNCLESIVDEKQTKMSVVKNIFKFGGSLTKLALNTTSCAIKNAPKAVVAVASVKREIVHAVEDEWTQYQREQKEEALEQKIKQLKLKA